MISRIATPPIWFDEYAVPRYCAFACIAGGSMSSEPRRVLEYWRRFDPRHVEGNLITNSACFDLVRDPSLEIGIQPEWAEIR